MQLRMHLSFWAANALCQVILSFSFTNTTKSSFLVLVSVCSASSLYLCLGFPLKNSTQLHDIFKWWVSIFHCTSFRRQTEEQSKTRKQVILFSVYSWKVEIVMCSTPGNLGKWYFFCMKEWISYLFQSTVVLNHCLGKTPRPYSFPQCKIIENSWIQKICWSRVCTGTEQILLLGFVLGKWHKEADSPAVILSVFPHSVGKHASWWFTPAAARSVVLNALVQHQSELAGLFSALQCQEKGLNHAP